MSDVDLNLDDLAPTPLRVELGGKVWKLPGGPQSEIIVDMWALFEAFGEALSGGDVEKAKSASDDLRAIFTDLFAEFHSEEELDAMPRLSDDAMSQIFALMIEQVKNAQVAVGDGARPTQPTAARPKKPARSRRSSTPNRRRTPASST